MTPRTTRKSRWFKWAIFGLTLVVILILIFRRFERQIYMTVGYYDHAACAGISDRDAKALLHQNIRAGGDVIEVIRDPTYSQTPDSSVDVVFKDQKSASGTVTGRIFEDCSVDWHKNDPDI